MNILILGAGQVGSTTATQLAKEDDNEVTVVDIDPEKLTKLASRVDLQTIEGNAAFPETLQQSGAETADMLIAVTSSDEVNMIACQIASTLFNTPKKIARIRAQEYSENKALFSKTNIPVDYYINPEQLVTEHVSELILHPGAFQVLDFANGMVRMVGVRAQQQGLLVGQPIKSLHEHLGNEQVRIAAVYREGESIDPDGDTVIKKDDEVFFIAAREDIDFMISEFIQNQERVRKVIIAGGGGIGMRLASKLETTNQVKVIERSKTQAKKIAELLEDSIVLVGDAADDNLLLEESIETTDVFVALTNSEEANILSSMLAKKLGCKKAMALINKASYSGLIETGSIDIAISPQQITIGSLLTHVREGDVVKVHSLKRGNAEALEAIAHKHKGSKVVGKMIDTINLPKGAFITAVLSSSGDLKTLHHSTIIEPDDHVIVFITDRERIADVERLF
ncbi:MAG: Trk system potassium transporter TrkA [Gammaproteobacteria bacterium]|nr:Trk system potassium transporter TrkA [Gammaproteobacteria bacterium]|tara:strand:+ start:5947 stop:7302 length:1356 start_codon:yes stop_codon:yes gene_type:complete